MPNLKPLTGLRFGRLIVVSRGRNDKWNQTTWHCRCDCGAEKSISGANLRKGNTASCGCYKIEKIAALNRTHGQSGALTKTTEYRIWANMVNRCTNPNNPAFKHYGGRGIRVCRRWQKFENFLADMGPRGGDRKARTLDRVNNDGDYEPRNCRWRTMIQQGNNKRTSRLVEWRGRSQTVTQWARELGLASSLIYARLDRGMSPELAMNAPVTLNGSASRTVKGWVKLLN